MARDLCRTLFQYDPEGLEVQKIAMTTSVGIWMIWADHEDLFGRSPLYTCLTRSLPHWAWGLLFICLGVFQLASLKRNDVKWRAASAKLSFVLWSFITALLIINNTPGPSVLIFAVIALSDAWVYLRLILQEDQEEQAPFDADATC